MLFVLSPYNVLSQGLGYLGRKETEYNDKNIRLFKSLYGSNPIVIANIWEDLQNVEEIAIPQKYKSNIGFHELMISIYFVWVYPKNANILGNSFGICARRVQGRNLWRWIKRFALLKKIKFIWPTNVYNDPSSQIIIISVDGIDFETWEYKHPTATKDTGRYSHKSHGAALKYQIAIDVHESKVVSIQGPFKGAVNDRTIFNNGEIEGEIFDGVGQVGIKEMIPDGKKVITDGVYGDMTQKGHNEKLSLPNAMDDKITAKFKARARARHESFNGRLCHFNSLSQKFHHAKDKHRYIFESVAVIVQYQMDLGAGLFDV